MDADGSHQTRLTFGGGYNASPDWSADGLQIVYQCENSICVMNSDGSDLTEIATVFDIQALSWQPAAVADPPPVLDYLYLTPRTPGNVDGIAVTRQDVLLHNTTTDKWQMFFDGSDVGITQPLAAFVVTDNLQLLLVFKGKQTLPPFSVALYATPYDIVRFVPESLGETTTGYFEFEIDGGDIGLTKAGERIDALDELDPYHLLISTVGTSSVPMPGGGKMNSQNEDLIVFEAVSVGTSTAGTWAPYFNGTAVPGLAVENVTGANVDELSGDLYLSMPGAAMVGGVGSNANQIIKLEPSGGGYTVSRFWRGVDHGFHRDIAALNMP